MELLMVKQNKKISDVKKTYRGSNIIHTLSKSIIADLQKSLEDVDVNSALEVIQAIHSYLRARRIDWRKQSILDYKIAQKERELEQLRKGVELDD